MRLLRSTALRLAPCAARMGPRDEQAQYSASVSGNCGQFGLAFDQVNARRYESVMRHMAQEVGRMYRHVHRGWISRHPTVTVQHQHGHGDDIALGSSQRFDVSHVEFSYS